MSKRIELQIQGSTNFAFDVEGEWMPEMLPEYRPGNPTDGTAPVLTSIREVWTIRGCRIRTSDGTLATLWTEFLAFRARIESKTAHPTYVRLVRDPDGDNAVLLALGPATYEDLRFDAIEAEADPQVPAASWRSTATLTIVVSAVNKKADANGIVNWRQVVDVSYPNGLRVLEWRTDITTKETVSAITKAQAFARIPVASLGTDHAYDTNGPDGLDYASTDADEQNSRVPTEVSAVSRIRQWGVPTLVSAGQANPTEYGFTIVTETTVDETVVTTTASATGPNALAWCLTKKPGGATESVRVDAQAVFHATITWVKRSDRTAASGTNSQDVIKIKLTGGKRSQLWRATTGGHAPHHSVGGFSWFQVTVEVTSFRVGSEDITLPGLLPAPWIVDLNASEEGEAEPDGERQQKASQNKYRRSARLVYRSATMPDVAVGIGAGRISTALLEAVRAADRVDSYYLE